MKAESNEPSSVDSYLRWWTYFTMERCDGQVGRHDLMADRCVEAAACGVRCSLADGGGVKNQLPLIDIIFYMMK